MKAATDALMGIPGYESIAGDLQSIAQRNSKLASYGEIRNSLKALPAVNDWLSQASPNHFEALRLVSDVTKSIYLIARLGQLRDRALLGLLKVNGELRLLSGNQRHAANVLVKSFEEWGGDGLITLSRFDVYYRLRRLFYTVYSLKSRLYDGEPANETERAMYRDVWHRLNHQIKLTEIVRYAMETAIDVAVIPLDDLIGQRPDPAKALEKWRMAESLLNYILTSTDKLSTAGPRAWGHISDADRNATEFREREDFMQQWVRQRIVSAGSQTPGTPTPAGNLLFDLDRQESQILSLLPPGDLIRVEYCRFVLIDAYLFPVERIGNIEAKDPIRTVRISPIDSKFGVGKNKTVEDKLCGQHLGHFGGFMKRSWRANDIMWGRLDALSQLITCIVTPERVSKLAAHGYEFAAADFGLPAMFPNSDPAETALLQADLTQLAAYAKDHMDRPPREENWSSFEQFQDRLIRAAQAEILEVEIENVMGNAIEQQILWNQYRVPSLTSSFRPESQTWNTGVRQIDRAVLSVALEKLTQGNIASAPGKWTRFFYAGQYRIATESLAEDIPKPVLLEIATQASLILQNCLADAAGPRMSDKIRSNPVFRFGVNYPLRATYGYALFQRTAPEFARAASAVVLVLSLVALTIGIVWWEDLIRTHSDTFHPGRFGLLIVAPVAALLLQIFLYGRVRSAAFTLFVLIVAALGTLGLMQAGLVTWQNGTRFIAPALAWLFENRKAIWIGVATALITALPFRGLWREIRIAVRNFRG